MRLVAGEAELVVAPETGGAVVSWTIGGRPIFRPANPTATDARDHACYPLVPFSNRVANRRFSFAGQSYALPDLLAGWAIHGAGWQCAWTRKGSAIELTYPGGALWPFAFDAEQVFDLTPTSLSMVMRITNRHDAPAPAALGLHPFFPRDDATLLQVACGAVWLGDADMIPHARTAVPAEWDFSTARPLGGVGIDNCFAGWDGKAVLTWPQRGERVVIQGSANLGHLVIYVPRGQAFAAIEPVGNMTDGLNRMDSERDHGMTVLAPGERLEAWITMTVEGLV